MPGREAELPGREVELSGHEEVGGCAEEHRGSEAAGAKGLMEPPNMLARGEVACWGRMGKGECDGVIRCVDGSFSSGPIPSGRLGF